jgi:hypothetical protein
MEKERTLIATRGDIKLYYTHTEALPYKTVVHGFTEKDGVETPVDVESILRFGYWKPVRTPVKK